MIKIKKFFQSFWGGVIIVLLIGLLAYGLYSYFYQGEVVFNIEGPSEMRKGENTEFIFTYTNNSRVTLENTELVIRLPEGIISEENPEKQVIVINLGQVLSGDSNEKVLPFMAFLTPQNSKTINASLRYQKANITAVFEETQEKNIIVSDSVFRVEFMLPRQVFAEQLFVSRIHWENLTNRSFSQIRIRAQWPESFTLEESNPPPTEDNNIWYLGELAPASQGRINLENSLAGHSGENKELTVFLEKQIANNFYPIAQETGFIALIENPLALSTLVNQTTVYNADLGDELNFTITFQNNFNTALRDLVVTTQLSNNVFDFRTLRASHRGFFTLRNRTIIWRGTTVPHLYVLNPGERGELTFSVRLQNPEQHRFRHADQKNTQLEVRTTVESPTMPPQIEEGGSVKTSSLLTIKLNTQPSIVVDSYFRDAVSRILNTGPLPLRVDQPTHFTIHWNINNTFNALNNVEVRATLPQGVEFTNRVAGNYGENAPIFDEDTREVVWRINSIPAGSGTLTRALSAVFQIKVTPTINQINQSITLLGTTNLTATDAFTRNNFQIQFDEVSSNNLTDKTVLPGSGIVR